MKTTLGVGLALAALLAFAVPASALVITNNDTAAHQVTVIDGDAKAEHDVAAGAEIEVPCAAKCTASLADKPEIEVEADDKLVIEKGEMKKSEED
jgi:hypothetical protein